MGISKYYGNEHIGTSCVSFIVENGITVELKTVIELEDVYLAQAINCLEAYNMETDLLIN